MGIGYSLIAGLLGAGAAIAIVFSSERIQESIAWRSAQIFGRSSAYQMDLERATIALWSRGIATAPENSTVLLGDSHFHGLPASALGPNTINLAIGGLTVTRLEKYLKSGELVMPPKVRRFIVLIGQNDIHESITLDQINSAVKDLFTRLTSQGKLQVVSLIPGEKIKESEAHYQKSIAVNKILSDQCLATPQCAMITSKALLNDNGIIKPQYAAPDGIHLNELGYKKLLETLL